MSRLVHEITQRRRRPIVPDRARNRSAILAVHRVRPAHSTQLLAPATISSHVLVALAFAWRRRIVRRAIRLPQAMLRLRPRRATVDKEDLDIALVLPLDAPAYARAADACAPASSRRPEAAGSATAYRVIAHGEDGVLAAFEARAARGARVIVGPLVRDDLKVVAAMALDLPFTIALNQFDEAAAAAARSTRSRCRSRATRASSRAACANAPPTPGGNPQRGGRRARRRRS